LTQTHPCRIAETKSSSLQHRYWFTLQGHYCSY